jgi:hypothetical protein
MTFIDIKLFRFTMSFHFAPSLRFPISVSDSIIHIGFHLSLFSLQLLLSLPELLSINATCSCLPHYFHTLFLLVDAFPLFSYLPLVTLHATYKIHLRCHFLHKPSQLHLSFLSPCLCSVITWCFKDLYHSALCPTPTCLFPIANGELFER